MNHRVVRFATVTAFLFAYACTTSEQPGDTASVTDTVSVDAVVPDHSTNPMDVGQDHATSPVDAIGQDHVTTSDAGDASPPADAAIDEAPQIADSSIEAAAQTCADEPFPTTGTMHYVCDCGPGAAANCAVGSDSAAGTSPSAPWQTWTQAWNSIPSMNAGDTLAFCKGGSFNDTASPFTASFGCRASNPCVFRDYVPPWASGNEGAPKINVASGQNGFVFVDSGDADHDEGYRVLNLDVEGGGAANVGLWCGNDVSDVTFCNMTVNGFTMGVYVAGSNPPASTNPGNGTNARIVVRGSTITNNVDMGYLGACTGCSLQYNYFNHNGGHDISVHAIYVEDSQVENSMGTYDIFDSVGETFVGNEIDNSEQPGGMCNGVAFVVHGSHTNMTISGNTVREDVANTTGGCYGISVGPGYGRPEHFTNVEISGNTVINPGGIGIGASQCVDCTIENNLVLAGTASPVWTGAIVMGDPQQDGDPCDPPGTGGIVRSNTVYVDNGTNHGVGISVGREGTGYVIANNAILASAGTSGPFSCLNLPLPLSSYSFVDNNLCYFPGASGGYWEYTTRESFAAWQAASHFDTHSLNLDPQFVNLAFTNYDFRPAAGSPLIGAGDTTHGSMVDFTGATRPSPPDIGAFQH